MLVHYLCLILITTARGEYDSDKKVQDEIYYGTNNINYPESYQHLPSSQRVPVEDNYPLYKYYEPNKDHRSRHPLVLGSLVYENPLLMALLISTALGVPSIKYQGYNHPDQVTVNPYLTLLLSQYGRYLPVHALGSKGLYYYAASNNYHNNKPFGAYKVNEETK